MIAGAAAGAGANAASAVISQIIIRIFTGTFNPTYKKEDRRRMRYVQKKYALAYQLNSTGGNSTATIAEIDPNSRLLMAVDGLRPANPFQDEPQFEESLLINFHPVSGHQGRFVASHALACIGVINDYQIQRRMRPWIPGLSSPGHPNDFVNLFLEEMKVWMRTQMTLDAVHADELARRDNYITKIKNDNYFWCFPPETESRSIHKVIDFVHDKVKNALELISREEKNKSLQTFFKELNDHTTNAFEFGKQFLAYLLCPTKKIGGNLTANAVFDGRTYETGKLHNLLESATNLMLESYIEDMSLTQDRLHNNNYKNQNIITNSNNSNKNMDAKETNYDSTELIAYTTNNNNSSNTTNNNHILSSQDTTTPGEYLVEITDYEESSLYPIVYIVELIDPKGHKWVIKKSYNDFLTLHNLILRETPSNFNNNIINNLYFPEKLKNKLIYRDKNEYYDMGRQLQYYLSTLLYIANNFNSTVTNHICLFLEIKALILLNKNKKELRRAENVPNAFLSLKKEFNNIIVGKTNNTTTNNSSNSSSNNNTTSSSNDNKRIQTLLEFRNVWGIEMVIKIFNAYSLLQRMATVLGWTLEINHFFISMFGNTLTFSKLPLRNILYLQKDIMSNFLTICNELFEFACKINADSKYKWHKNLQMVENHYNRIKFHIEKSMNLITLIDSEHLDYEMQMKRLKDVHERFQPLMNRIDGSLNSIQLELDLPVSLVQPSFPAIHTNSSNTTSAGAAMYAEAAGAGGGTSNYPSAGNHSNRGNLLAIREQGEGSSGADAGNSSAYHGHTTATTERENNGGGYVVEEPIEQHRDSGNSNHVFSRDQSPDIPTQSDNPLQQLSERNRSIDMRRTAACGAATASSTGTRPLNTENHFCEEGYADDHDGPEFDPEDGSASKVCVIS